MTTDVLLGVILGGALASLLWVAITWKHIYALLQRERVQVEMNAAVWAFLRHKGYATDGEVKTFVHTAIDKAFEAEK